MPSRRRALAAPGRARSPRRREWPRRPDSARARARQRLHAPRTMAPELAHDAPTAAGALRLDLGDLPALAHLAVTPRAVAHPRHELAAGAARARAARGIAMVAVAPRARVVPALAIAPRAVAPVELGVTPAARTLRGEARLAAVHLQRLAAPRAAEHRFRYGTLAARTLVVSVEHAPVALLELFVTHLAPVRRARAVAAAARARVPLQRRPDA